MAIIKFTVNKKVIKDVLDDIEYDITTASADPRIKMLIGEKIIQYANQYVPKKTGALRESAHIANHGRQIFVEYGKAGVGKTRHYAQNQYYSDDSGWKRHTPGTTSYWLEKVLSPGAYKYQLLNAYIKKLVSEEVKKRG